MQLVMIAQRQQMGTTEGFVSWFPVNSVVYFSQTYLLFFLCKSAVICSHWHADADFTASLQLAF